MRGVLMHARRPVSRDVIAVLTCLSVVRVALLQRWAWAAVNTTGIPPAPRARHAAVSNAFLTFGGPDSSAPTGAGVAQTIASYSGIDLRPGICLNAVAPPTSFGVEGTISPANSGADDDVAAAIGAAQSMGARSSSPTVASPGRGQNAVGGGAPAAPLTGFGGSKEKAGAAPAVAVIQAGPTVGTPACPAVLLVLGGICGAPTLKPVVGSVQV
jgi:hypothetical protein